MDKHCGNEASKSCEKGKQLRVINIGLQNFYEALLKQNIKAVQVIWRPPVKQSKEISDLLDMLL